LGTPSPGLKSCVNSISLDFLQTPQNGAHVLAHRQLIARDTVMLVDVRALQQPQPRLAQILAVDSRQCLLGALSIHTCTSWKSRPAAHLVELVRGALHLFVRQQPAHELGARSNSSCGPAAGRGSSMRDLISIRTAAITR